MGPSTNTRSALSYDLTNKTLETQRSYQTTVILRYMQTHASIELWDLFKDIYNRQRAANDRDQHGEESDDIRDPIDSATRALDGIIKQLPSLLCDRREGMTTNVKLYMEHLCATLQKSTFPPSIEAAKEALSIAMHYSDVMLSINTQRLRWLEFWRVIRISREDTKAARTAFPDADARLDGWLLQRAIVNSPCPTIYACHLRSRRNSRSHTPVTHNGVAVLSVWRLRRDRIFGRTCCTTLTGCTVQTT